MCDRTPTIPPEYEDIPLDEVPLDDGLAFRFRRMGFTRLGDLNGINLEKPGQRWTARARRGVQELVGSARSGAFEPQTDPTPGNAIVFLAEKIDAALARMDNADVVLLEQRFGTGTADPMTLEQIAHQHGLSRQRILQVQSRILARIRRAGGPNFSRIARSLASKCARLGLFISTLHLDRLHSSRSGGPPRAGRFYASVLSLLFPDLPFWMRLSITRGRRSEAEERIRDTLDGILDARCGEVPIRLGYFGVMAFVPDTTVVSFRDAVLDAPHYETVGEATPEWAIRREPRMTTKVGAMRVLEQSDALLTAAEINARGRQRFGDAWPDRRDRSFKQALSANRENVFLLGRGGRYGLARHIELSEDRRRALADRFCQAIAEMGRPMSTSEFAHRHGAAFDGGVDVYVLAAIADMDGRFVRAGRKFRFGLKQGAPPPA